MRRASVSVPANIAEGFGGAPVGEYARFGGISNGSLKELETYIEADRWLAYFSDAEVSRGIEMADVVGRMLNRLKRALAKKPAIPKP